MTELTNSQYRMDRTPPPVAEPASGLPAQPSEEEGASDRQRWYLGGFAISVPDGITKSHAGQMIAQALEDGHRADPVLLYAEDEPPTEKQERCLARNGLEAQTAREASVIIDGLPKRIPTSERVRALAAQEPFRHGIVDLARRLGLTKATVAGAVRRLEADGLVSVRLAAGRFPRRLVGVPS